MEFKVLKERTQVYIMKVLHIYAWVNLLYCKKYIVSLDCKLLLLICDVCFVCMLNKKNKRNIK